MNEKQKQELFARVEENSFKRDVHKLYSENLKREPDFEVEYEIDIPDSLEGINPTQGMRCDFLYGDDDPEIDGIHMIYPEILDDKGNVILDKSISIPPKGKAWMWILFFDERAEYHQKRIKVGVKGHWVIGSNKFANVTVSKVLGLDK